MLKNSILSSWQMSSAVNKPSGIFRRAEMVGESGAEYTHFLPILNAGVEALSVKEAKPTAMCGVHDSLKNMGIGSDIGKGEKIERKQEIISGARVPEAQIDDPQVGLTEIQEGLPGTEKADVNAVQDGSADIAHEDGGENDAVGAEHSAKEIETQSEGVAGFNTESENCAPFSTDTEQVKGISNIVDNTLRENGLNGKDIRKILSTIKDAELKSVPSKRQAEETAVGKGPGEGIFKGTPSDSANGKIAMPESLLAALREKGIDEKDISKMLAAIKDGEVKSVPLERQAGGATVEKSSGMGMFKEMPSNSNADRGDGRGESSSSSGKGKFSIPESFLAEQTDVTACGGDSKVIKSGNGKPIEGRLLVDQIAGQLPLEADKGFSRLRIALFPEKLGGLDMDIIIRENKIHVVLVADRPDVRQALQGNADQLKNALQNQGLQVDGIDFLLRDSPRGMDEGSGGGHLSWRGDNDGGKGGERKQDVPASSAMLLLEVGLTSGTADGGISLFV